MPARALYHFNDLEFPTTHIAILYRWLIQQGYRQQELLKGSPQLRQVLDNPDGHMAFALQKQFMLSAVKLTGNELLGYELGRYIGEHSSGLMGYAVKCSPTLDKALDTLSRYFSLRNNLFEVNKLVREKECILKVEQGTEFAEAEMFLHLMFTSANISLLQGAGERLVSAVKSVHFTFNRPACWKRGLFGNIRVVFAAGFNGIVFDKNALHRQIPSDDPVSLQNLTEYFDLKLSVMPRGDFIDQVRKAISRQGNMSASQNDIAAVMGLSPRTLRRKLQDSDITYKEILNQVRTDKAIGLLQDSKLRIYQVGELMGYTNLSNFRRAFKMWTGKSFKDFR
ncbi:AraC family transcriptional regulator ligand-binding domain-containing protein [Thalassomonas viridans]|uniref:AraC family transcriptional regulator ligand-binding domain-containing protein n=1 Tax=Thalassomonas viridans TaxID=137584 RepID=A0AAE9YYB3_9GAMM|nr:AraC family transcriptional regulator [Thalassomonas viridans]WDE03471.1 AraC family transcriptional regulator ligand-binding domain-containing protein [Thalassomonas viridans]